METEGLNNPKRDSAAQINQWIKIDEGLMTFSYQGRKTRKIGILNEQLSVSDNLMIHIDYHKYGNTTAAPGGWGSAHRAVPDSTDLVGWWQRQETPSPGIWAKITGI
jgi:hypothetical protein